MAGAFDNFDPTGLSKQQPNTSAPTQSPPTGGAFGNFKPVAPTQSVQDGDTTSSYDPNWKGTGNPLLDFFTRPRAKTEDWGAALKDVGLAGLGYGSQNFAVPSSMRPDVAQAKQNLGWMAYPTAAISYALGPGKILGPLSGGSALAEGALAGASSTVGEGNYDPLDIAKNTVESAVAGKVGQTAGKYVGAGLRALASKFGYGGAAPITQSAQTATQDAFGNLKDIEHNPKDVVAATQGAQSDLDTMDPGGGTRAAAPRAVSELTRLQNQASTSPVQTAHDVVTSMQKLQQIQRQEGGAYNDVVPPIVTRLQDVLENATPTSNHPVGAGAEQLQIGKQANAQFQDAKFLQGQQQSLVDYPGSDISPAVKAYADKWYPQSGMKRNALLDLYQSQQGSDAVPRWQTTLLHEGLHGGLTSAVGGAGAHLAGVDPWLGAAAGAATYALGKPTLKAMQHFGQGIDTTQAFDKAYSALTGQFQTPFNTQNVGNLLRQLGIGAANQ